jgi:uncharacterized membrane protein YsdA (DUF1294 family)
MTKPNTLIDLDTYAIGHKLEINIVSEEHKDDRGARLEQQKADAKLNRVREVVLLAVAVVFILALGASCLAISVSHKTTVEDKKWAWSTLTLITGAVLGFLFGRVSTKR